MKMIWWLAAKDLRIEGRSKRSLMTVLFFALLVLIVFQFAFDPGDPSTRPASPGILWVALLFPGMIRLNQSLQMESEEDAIQGLALAPIDRGQIFLGKFLANWIFLLFSGVLITAAFLLFFNFALQWRLLWLLLLIALGLAGFAAVGTVLAALVSESHAKEVMMPILTFPVLVPVLIAAVNGSQEVLVRDQFFAFQSWLRILASFDVVYLATGYLVFDYVIGD